MRTLAHRMPHMLGLVSVTMSPEQRHDLRPHFHRLARKPLHHDALAAELMRMVRETKRHA